MEKITKKPWLNDVAVLSIFFARPKVLAKSFESIHQARPRKLLLWQDGPRLGREDDLENIRLCREVVENIDWDCEVYKNYHDENMGCDPSTHYAHKWAFTIVDKCIILEDDIVPSQSFYPFCKELLDKYADDLRVDRICGMNVLGRYEADGDYFFCKYGNSWGWATWKRTADKWETDYHFLDEPYARRFLSDLSKADGSKIDVIERLERERAQGIPYWEMVTGIAAILNHGLVIYPDRNLVCNVGLDANSTHAPSDIEKVSSDSMKYFFAQTFEYDFPLKHPRYVYDNFEYQRQVAQRTKKSLFSLIVGKLGGWYKNLLK